MERIIFCTDERDPAVSAKWPLWEACSIESIVKHLDELAEEHGEEAVESHELYYVCEIHHRDATVREYYAWMIEHCPGAVYVNRQCNITDKFTNEWLICDPDQAFAYKMRWGPCWFTD